MNKSEKRFDFHIRGDDEKIRRMNVHDHLRDKILKI